MERKDFRVLRLHSGDATRERKAHLPQYKIHTLLSQHLQLKKPTHPVDDIVEHEICVGKLRAYEPFALALLVLAEDGFKVGEELRNAACSEILLIED